MKKIVLFITLLVFNLTQAQCNQEVFSNSTENFLMMINGQELAFDVDVEANKTYKLNEIEANVMIFGAVSQTFEIVFLSSTLNSAGLPNTVLGTSTTDILSITDIGSFNGSPVKRVKLKVNNPYVLEATSSASKKFWIQIKFSGVGGSWEYTSASKIGLSGAVKNPNTGGNWSYTTEAGSDYELVYKTTAVCESLSTSKNEFDNLFTVYPNPTDTKVVIKANQNEVFTSSLYGINGSKIKDNYNKSNLDLSDLSTGIYFLKIKTAKGVGVKKLIKK